MASSLHAPDPTPCTPPCAGHSQGSFGRAMTRCECAGVTFEEAAGQIRAEQGFAEQALRRSGCGQICGACIPDLRRFLASL